MLSTVFLIFLVTSTLVHFVLNKKKCDCLNRDTSGESEIRYSHQSLMRFTAAISVSIALGLIIGSLSLNTFLISDVEKNIYKIGIFLSSHTIILVILIAFKLFQLMRCKKC